MMKTMQTFALAALLVLPACGGIDLPDSDGDGIPDIIDPCPNDPDLTCGLEPGEPEAYDCDNPPALSGLVKVVDPIAGQYIVVSKSRRIGTTDLTSFAQSLGVQDAELLDSVNGFSAALSVKTLATLLKDPSVAYVQQSARVSINTEWNLDRVDQRSKDLDGLYEPFATGEGANVAVVDTGITDHPDFEDRLQEDCFTAIIFGGCSDGHGHGTHVSGTAVGKTYGVAKRAKLWAVRVLDDRGSGTDTDVIKGIDWVVGKKQQAGGAWVINMSLGGSPSPAFDAAVCSAIAAGVTNVVAAGNDSQDAYHSSPARVVQAITVGASESGDGAAYFSNRGPGVDLYAPGVSIRSAKPGGGTDVMQGTSMASPHVAGAAALFSGTPSEIEAKIVALATPDALKNIPSETVNLLLYVGAGE